MKLKVGDQLVFVGGESENRHYDNFEVGKSYRINKLGTIGYDLDDVSGYSSECVIFENHSHGCLLSSVESYFVLLEDYRNLKIENIIK